MKRFTTRTGKLVHEGQFLVMYGGSAVRFRCGRSLNKGRAVLTEEPVNCPRCIDRRRMFQARRYFCVTITPRRLGRVWGQKKTVFGRDARCSCGKEWFTNEYQNGINWLDAEVHAWADLHMLQHADELDAFEAEHGRLPRRCMDCETALTAGYDSAGAKDMWCPQLCMEPLAYTPEDWEIGQLWKNRA